MFVEIDYKNISNFYSTIILKIFHELSKTYSVGDDGEFDDEFLNAYGYLQKATWRLNDIDEMTDFFNDEGFFYFAMNNLSSARHRIGSYLKDTEWKFEDKIIYDYQKFDDIVMDYFQTIRLNHNLYNENHKWYVYYNDLCDNIALKRYVLDEISDLKRCLDFLEEKVRLQDVENVDYDKLSELDKLLCNLNMCFSIDL